MSLSLPVAGTPTMIDKLAYRMDEAASAVGLSRATLYRLVEKGDLRTIKVGHRTLIRREVLVAFLDRRGPIEPNTGA